MTWETEQKSKKNILKTFYHVKTIGSPFLLKRQSMGRLFKGALYISCHPCIQVLIVMDITVISAHISKNKNTYLDVYLILLLYLFNILKFDHSSFPHCGTNKCIFFH